MAMTWAERMIAKGIEQGLEQGRELGRELGREQEARQIVLDLLGERFGAVPDRVRRQIEEIESLDRLRFLAKRVINARSFEEIGLG